MVQLNLEQQVEQAKEEFKAMFSNYSFSVKTEDIDSVFDDGRAFRATVIADWERGVKFLVRVEMIPEDRNPSSFLPSVEFGEDSWEEIDKETVWRHLFWDALDKAAHPPGGD